MRQYAETTKILMPQGFLAIEKARWFPIKTIVLIWYGRQELI
jgi:hypothetical protein